jgi:enoyl-CoA hydratase/carnithine racemase
MQQRGFEAIDNAVRRSAWNDISKFPKPLIAAVEGICFVGGHELALLADIIVAGETARFGQPEINVGILPGDGATQRLTRAGGKSLAVLMVLTGERISAHQALGPGSLRKSSRSVKPTREPWISRAPRSYSAARSAKLKRTMQWTSALSSASSSLRPKTWESKIGASASIT